jgi:hypothetical protein
MPEIIGFGSVSASGGEDNYPVVLDAQGNWWQSDAKTIGFSGEGLRMPKGKGYPPKSKKKKRPKGK